MFPCSCPFHSCKGFLWKDFAWVILICTRGDRNRKYASRDMFQITFFPTQSFQCHDAKKQITLCLKECLSGGHLSEEFSGQAGLQPPGAAQRVPRVARVSTTTRLVTSSLFGNLAPEHAVCQVGKPTHCRKTQFTPISIPRHKT